MNNLFRKLWKYRFAIAIVTAIVAVNLLPDRAVDSVRANALELAVLMPPPSGSNKSADDSALMLRKENALLREQVRRLKTKVAILEREFAAFGRLRDVLPDEIRGAVSAGVILKRGISSYRRTILVDRGGRHGIKTGMPVVCGYTLVGVVIAAGRSYSRVQTLTDPAFRAVGFLGVTGEEGLFEGTGGEKCMAKMRYLRSAENIRPGDPVLTAGTFGRLPRGIVIGTAVGRPSRPENGFRWVTVAPDLKVELLESVTILTGYPRGEKLEESFALESEKTGKTR
ncbi:MAG: rod shape-determining protein MreC [Planctomycetota bacterium]|nr:MAG: rod shape-determining protein MreC [Planctomycetota bacterium]